MAHVQDLWEKTVGGRRIRTSRYGKGNRWQARYLDPDGHERTRTSARKQDAERFVVTVRADVLRGATSIRTPARSASLSSPSAARRTDLRRELAGGHRAAAPPSRQPSIRPP